MTTHSHQGRLSAKQIKTFSEILLLLSFLAQTILFDYFDDKSNKLDKAYVFQSIIDKGAELKELKYFVANFPSDSDRVKEYQQLNIKMAAKKIALSQAVVIIVSEKAYQDKIDPINNINIKASNVKDFDSYMEYLKFIDSISINAQAITLQSKDVATNKEFCRNIFIAFYILGAALLIYANTLKDNV